jgi:hypothetical protein
MILQELLKRQTLIVFGKGDNTPDYVSKTKVIGGVLYTLHENFSPLYKVFLMMNILNCVSFKPKLLIEDPNSKDPLLRSSTKLAQINKLNRTKIYINKPYLKFLDSLLQMFNDQNKHKELIDMIG